MKHAALLLLAALGLCSVAPLFSQASLAGATAPAADILRSRAESAALVNPRIDYPGFQQLVIESAAVREGNRLTEDAFLALMQEPGAVVLDARTESRYRLLHITGAVNVPFTEFTAETLAAAIPSKDTPVLIYCNNNFEDRLDAFPTKAVRVSLNVSTYASLRAYGYTRVYELGPLLRVATSKLPFTAAQAEELAFAADPVQRGVVSSAVAPTVSFP